MKILFGKKLFGLAVLTLALAAPGAVAAEALELRLGHSQVIGPIEEMATVIVGDDGVAGATLGGGGTIILTGKTLGATNLIVLDEVGRELLSSQLSVVPVDRRPTKMIQVVKGAGEAQSYACAPTTGCARVAGNVAAGNGPTQDEADEGETSAPEATPEVTPEVVPETDGAASEEQISLDP